VGSSMDGKPPKSLNDMHCTVHFQYPLTRSEITLIHSAGQETFRAKLTEINNPKLTQFRAHAETHFRSVEINAEIFVWGKI